MQLSKSLFMAACGCKESAWYRANARDELPQPTETDLAMMEQGSAVGRFACTCFPDGTRIEGERAVEQTRKLLAEHCCLFEAAFSHERLLCKVDILRPAEDGWDIIEVKSSKRIKDEHLLDVAFQAHVLRCCGLTVNRTFVMHIDGGYIKNGDVQAEELFETADVTHDIQDLLDCIDERIQEALDAIDGDRPDLGTYHRCGNRHCSLGALVDLPEHNVTELYRRNGEEFLENGIAGIADIKEPNGLNTKQTIQWQAVKTGTCQVDKKKLRAWLDTLQEPISYLDFETINPAIPLFDGTCPYQHIPFQYSLHIERSDGVEHHEFLGDGRTDPRKALLEQLMQDLPSTGRVLAHYMSFERRVLTSLGEAFPEHTDWVRSVCSRLADTIVPFRNFWYYHPEQHGSCSMKNVLPALTGRSYDGMGVGDGAMAQVAYTKLAGDITEQERVQIRKDLLTYCGLDTEGMVDILAVLRDAVKD